MEGTTQTLTVTNGSGFDYTGSGTIWIDPNYYQPWPYWGPWTWPTVVSPQPPRECSGDVHVFPCPHCATCKCGAATVKRTKKK